MKALLINGSARANGNTRIALEEVGKTLKENGVDYEIVGIGEASGRSPCTAA